MADTQPRGGRGGGRGGAHRGGRGGGRGGAGNAPGGKDGEKPKKENILDLSKYMDKAITVKFNGGREVKGTLKGYDALMNLVLDEGEETVRGKFLPLPRGLLGSPPALRGRREQKSWTRADGCGR